MGALAYAAAITACMIAWGYLVFAAVDFGGSARSGTTVAWLFLGLAAIGAAACLFVGIMLTLRLLATLGLSRHDLDGQPVPPRPTGGRRAAR